MQSNAFSRRTFSMYLAAFCSGLGFARAAFAASGNPEPVLLPRARFPTQRRPFVRKLYSKRAASASMRQLTDAKAVCQSCAAQRGWNVLGKCAHGNQPGCRRLLSLFGGHIVGRHVELAPNERVVQAWRVADWPPGVYSIAKFELSEQVPAPSSFLITLAFPTD